MIQQLRQADYILSNCGRPTPPPGARWIDLPYAIPYRIQNAQTVTITDALGNGILFASIAGTGITVMVSIPDDSGTPGNALTITVSGQKITVQLATDGGGVITTTFTLLAAAIAASAAAAALVTTAIVGSGAAVVVPPIPVTNTVIQGTIIGLGIAAARVENKSRVPFLVRGVSVSGANIQPFRVWFTNRNLEQLVSVGNFKGSGAGMRTLQPEVQVDPGGKIVIESQAAV